MLLNLGGCAGAATSIASNLVMSALGMKKDNTPPPPKEITLTIHTARNLNADDTGHGLSAVLHIYKLKDSTAFNQASFDTLSNTTLAKQTLGADLIESKEQLLIPGQKYQFKEKVDAQNGYLALAVLFRTPNPQRWKLIAANAALQEKEPIIIGAHACALNVSNGWPDQNTADSKFLLSVAQCNPN